VKVSEEPKDVFSRMLLMFSLTVSWATRDEEMDFSQIMCVSPFWETYILNLNVNVCVCMHVCMHACVHVCVAL